MLNSNILSTPALRINEPLAKVYHDGSLFGDGTRSKPLRLTFSIETASQSLYQRWGTGTPEGAVTAPIGALYSRIDGGTGTSLYVKESGTGNTG